MLPNFRTSHEGQALLKEPFEVVSRVLPKEKLSAASESGKERLLPANKMKSHPEENKSTSLPWVVPPSVNVIKLF